jgi:hypothetical protein
MAVQRCNNILKLLIFVFIFQSNNINSLKLNEKYPSSLLLSNGDLFLVTDMGIRLYDSTFTTLKKFYNFDSENRMTTEDEAEKTAIAEYTDGTVITLVKNILYILNSGKTYIKKQDLTTYLENGKSFSLIPYAHDSPNYYYIVSFFDDGNISIKYFYFTTDTSLNQNNLKAFLTYQPNSSLGTPTNLRGNAISCRIMIYNSKDVLTCFYQINSPNELSVSSYYISENQITEVNIPKIFSPNDEASIIKSVISPDKKTALICYNRYYSYNRCLRYDITTNQFTTEEPYFEACKGRSTGLYVYYFPQKNEYMFICSNGIGFNVVTFNSNFQATILNNGPGNTEPYYSYGDEYCYNSFNFNIVYSSTINNYIIINDCSIGGSIKTGNTELQQLSGKNSNFNVNGQMDALNNNILDISEAPNEITEAPTEGITERPTDKITESPTEGITERPTEKITISDSSLFINHLNDIIKDKDPEQNYIIRGNNYTVIIKKVEDYIEESTVNIDFTECLKLLKEKYPSKEFRILQVILENKNEKCLTDHVEYKIYDQLGQEIDLSVCSNINILIEYEIKNTSSLDIEQISNFLEQGIDVFNINDVFFNDICFSYSDKNSSSDMILTDRVADIYQNYSLCEKGCEYDSLNIGKMSAYCSCKVKQNVNFEEGEGFFEKYITSTFIYSNFGVAKCYKLVFSIKGKLNNSGFWIFGILIIFHIPIYIFYFINGINPVLKYIIKTMESKGYIIKRILKTQQSVTFLRTDTYQCCQEPSQNLISKKDQKKTNKLQKKKFQKKT